MNRMVLSVLVLGLMLFSGCSGGAKRRPSPLEKPHPLHRTRRRARRWTMARNYPN